LLEGCPIVAAAPLIPRRALVVSGAFGARLRAEAVGEAIARGLVAGGAPAPGVAELDELAADFDARMRAARAVIVAARELDARAIARSAAFEVATRARQAGVPAYAVTAANRLSSFDTRVFDLQLVLEARTARALTAAGGRLAKVL
jgi:glycerate 2-kinase